MTYGVYGNCSCGIDSQCQQSKRAGRLIIHSYRISAQSRFFTPYTSTDETYQEYHTDVSYCCYLSVNEMPLTFKCQQRAFLILVLGVRPWAMVITCHPNDHVILQKNIQISNIELQRISCHYPSPQLYQISVETFKINEKENQKYWVLTIRK